MFSQHTYYVMLFVSDNCRLHAGHVVICDKLIVRKPLCLPENALTANQLNVQEKETG